MKGTTIFSAYLGAEQKLERHPGPDWDRIARQSATFFADIVGRLKVSDTCRKVWNAERGTPEQIITALFGLSSDEDHFWSGLVARLRTDTAQIVDQKAKIAELEAELLDRRTVELGQLMSDISEDHWAAGWMHYNEYALWAMVIDPTKRRYAMRDVPENQIARLKKLSEQIGGWIAYRVDPFSPGADIEKGEEFIPMAEWLEMFAKHEAIK